MTTETGKKRDLYIYNDFDSGLQQVVQDLWEILEEDTKKLDENVEPEISPIRLHISSYGGHVAYLQALLTAIGAQVAPVITMVEGAAYSCGSLLSVSGDYRMAGVNARLLIHPPSGMAFGEASYLKDNASALEETDKWCIEHYAKHSKLDKKDLKEAFKTHRQWYITAEEALEMGLIDEIIPFREIKYNHKKQKFTTVHNGESHTIKF